MSGAEKNSSGWGVARKVDENGFIRETDGGWRKIINRNGRKAYVLYRKNGCAFGGVIDWTPAAVPYQAMITLPRHEEKWFEELNPAKDYVTARLVAYEMAKYF